MTRWDDPGKPEVRAQLLKWQLWLATALVVLLLLFLGYSSTGAGLTGKTFWDLLQLLFLAAIPAALAWGAYWLNRQARQAEREQRERQAELERELATTQLQETVWQQYFQQLAQELEQGLE